MNTPTEGAPTPRSNDSGRLDGHTEGTEGNEPEVPEVPEAKEWDHDNRIRNQFK
jgi:hypothetical protein